MTAAISATGLIKQFGSTRALDGLDLTVLTGEVHGFLGRNGAGKTTTIRILLGLMRRTAGRHGARRGPLAACRPLAPSPGLRAGEVNLWPNLTGG